MDTVKKPTSLPCHPDTRAALDTFFRSFGFTQEGELALLAEWSLGTITGVGPRDALALAQARMEDWLEGTLGPAHASGGALLTRGRAAFLLCEGAQWGATVLMREPGALPVALVKALRASVPVPAPLPLPTPMPEQQLVLWPLGELFRRWWRAGEPDVSISR
jgi:hypothetical protein